MPSRKRSDRKLVCHQSASTRVQRPLIYFEEILVNFENGATIFPYFFAFLFFFSVNNFKIHATRRYLSFLSFILGFYYLAKSTTWKISVNVKRGRVVVSFRSKRLSSKAFRHSPPSPLDWNRWLNSTGLKLGRIGITFSRTIYTKFRMVELTPLWGL